MDTNGGSLAVRSAMCIFRHESGHNGDLEISHGKMPWSNRHQTHKSAGWWYGITMNLLSMLMTDANWDGSTRTPQLCLMPREKVHHKWLPTWLAWNMDGCTPQMGRKKHAFYSRQARTEKLISQMTRLLIKPSHNGSTCQTLST